MAAKREKVETEGFKNQSMTTAATRLAQGQGQKKSKKKVVALQLDAREQLALTYLGGASALKQLLAPEGRCVACREADADPASHLGALCSACAALQPTPD